MKSLLLTIALASLSAAALATTYVRVEKDGTKTYSDRPIPGGQPVEVEPPQTYSAPPAPSTPRSSGLAPEQPDNFKYASCTISPPNDATFTNPENVPIRVTLEPSLRPADTLTMLVDGKNVGAYTQNYVLAPADRGTHTVQVTVTDRAGRTLCSATSSFHVMRPSLNMPRRN